MATIKKKKKKDNEEKEDDTQNDSSCKNQKNISFAYNYDYKPMNWLLSWKIIILWWYPLEIELLKLGMNRLGSGNLLNGPDSFVDFHYLKLFGNNMNEQRKNGG